jgi:hypothetical protein
LIGIQAWVFNGFRTPIEGGPNHGCHT